MSVGQARKGYWSGTDCCFIRLRWLRYRVTWLHWPVPPSTYLDTAIISRSTGDLRLQYLHIYISRAQTIYISTYLELAISTYLLFYSSHYLHKYIFRAHNIYISTSHSIYISRAPTIYISRVLVAEVMTPDWTRSWATLGGRGSTLQLTPH